MISSPAVADVTPGPVAAAASEHHGCRTVLLRGWVHGRQLGALVCPHGLVLRSPKHCRAPTLAGGLCMQLVRSDLGHATCRHHRRRWG
jgi:hypothetical protein